MSWETQGRQTHGWFGHGTAATGEVLDLDPLFAPGNQDARVDAIAYGTAAALSPADRARAAARFDAPRMAQLRSALTAWSAAAALDNGAFADRFLPASTPGKAIEPLRAAADAARGATRHADLATASANLADAMGSIGLSNWPRFLADAAGRAGSASRPEAVVMAQASRAGVATDVRQSALPAPLTGPALIGFQARFDAATRAAYAKYSNDCSGYLRLFLQLMGHTDLSQGQANDIIRSFDQPNSGWMSVTAEQAVRLVAEGHIAVAGLADPGGNGHVEVVGPRMLARSTTGAYAVSPQVYAGATSSWPGARSQGEFTVADGWREADMAKVRFWVKL